MPENTGCKVEAACRKIAGIILNDLSNLIKVRYVEKSASANFESPPEGSNSRCARLVHNGEQFCQLQEIKTSQTSYFRIFSSSSNRTQTCAPKRQFYKFCLVMDKSLRKDKNPLTVIFYFFLFFFANTALSSNRAEEGVGVKASPAEPHHQRGRSPHAAPAPFTSIPAARSAQAPRGTDVA